MFRIEIKYLAAVMAIVSLLHIVSCVNEDYELSEDKVSLEVTVFEEGLVIPLGSTAEIKLKDLVPLLDEEYRSYLETRENGAYSITYMDTTDFSESLDQLQSLVSIEDIGYDQSVKFSLSDANGLRLRFWMTLWKCLNILSRRATSIFTFLCLSDSTCSLACHLRSDQSTDVNYSRQGCP